MTVSERRYHVKRIHELGLMIDARPHSDLQDKMLKKRREFVRQWKAAIAYHQEAIAKADAEEAAWIKELHHTT